MTCTWQTTANFPKMSSTESRVIQVTSKTISFVNKIELNCDLEVIKELTESSKS
jgi:hypothetical protein